MAITKVAQFASSPASTTDYQAQNAHINAFIQQMTGGVLHLTEWATTTVPQIAQGVYLRHAGVLYIVDTADFTIATGDLSAAGTYYIKLTTSGDSLAVAWEDTLTSYTWSHAYQGYYNGTSQILPYKIVYATTPTYTKYKIIDMTASTWSFIKSDGTIDTGGQISITGASRVRGYKSAVQSIAVSTAQIVSYTEDYDNLSEWDAVNHKFTATQAGYYHIYATLMTESVPWIAGNYFRILIYLNSAVKSAFQSMAHADVTTYLTASISDTLSLAAGDIIEIYATHTRSSSVNIIGDAKYSNFNIHRLS